MVVVWTPVVEFRGAHELDVSLHHAQVAAVALEQAFIVAVWFCRAAKNVRDQSQVAAVPRDHATARFPQVARRCGTGECKRGASVAQDADSRVLCGGELFVGEAHVAGELCVLPHIVVPRIHPCRGRRIVRQQQFSRDCLAIGAHGERIVDDIARTTGCRHIKRNRPDDRLLVQEVRRDLEVAENGRDAGDDIPLIVEPRVPEVPPRERLHRGGSTIGYETHGGTLRIHVVATARHCGLRFRTKCVGGANLVLQHAIVAGRTIDQLERLTHARGTGPDTAQLDVQRTTHCRQRQGGAARLRDGHSERTRRG